MRDWHRHEEYRGLADPDDGAEYWGEDGPAGCTAEEIASGINPDDVDAFDEYGRPHPSPELQALDRDLRAGLYDANPPF